MSSDFGGRTRLETAAGSLDYFSLRRLGDETGADVAGLPHTVKVLLENLLRRAGGRDVSKADVASLAGWPQALPGAGVAFMPSRILMQDFTGVPAVVDLAALRSAVARAGGDPERVNPYVAVDLVIDHSVIVDAFGSGDAYLFNIEREYERNRERYSVLRWAQQAFDGFRVVPPGMGICHQVNLEYLGRVVAVRDGAAIPDTVLGTDSHTPMINGLGILGWGVGGIEAEATMLGQPLFLPPPVVVGVKTTGALPAGTTATDLVLYLTEMLRAHGVVGKFVEFFGAGLSTMTVADRATLSNMCPEYGATAAYFPVDEQTLHYLRLTNREGLVDLVDRYTKEQGLFRTDNDPDPVFSELVELDLSSIEPSLAGPKRPQDRNPLAKVWESFAETFKERPSREPSREGIDNGSVVIAAITSCTNTSNPTVMIAAGLVARKAVEAGLESKPWVKTSLAPGSRVVTQYLDRAGLLPYLEKLRFNLVGYGCTTCIGNSGPLPDDVAAAVDAGDLAVAAVLSGNRNFEGRIHPQVVASYLGSPPLVVAYALAGTVGIDLTKDPIGVSGGKPVYLKDIWPSPAEVAQVVSESMSPELFDEEYGRIFEGDENWRKMPSPTGRIFEWDPDSTYIQEPPFFTGISPTISEPANIEEARVLVKVGDSITTDHISPAGSIKADSPAGRFLQEKGVHPRDFNQYGTRRGNHEVMLRGTFANIRLRNELAPDTVGPWTTHLPTGEQMTVYDASLRYQSEGVPLLVIAGKEYGSGSSRDWAAKGTALLGVKAVLAESYERIHRCNLVGMGVLPLQFASGESASSLGLSGNETFSIKGISGGITPGKSLVVEVTRTGGETFAFEMIVRIDGPAEIEYYRNGGILQMVLRDIMAGGRV